MSIQITSDDDEVTDSDSDDVDSYDVNSETETDSDSDSDSDSYPDLSDEECNEIGEKMGEEVPLFNVYIKSRCSGLVFDVESAGAEGSNVRPYNLHQ